jgi:hypothetical protein
MPAVKRIVLFKFKDATTSQKIDQIFEALGGLKDEIPGVLDFTCGAYSSSDGLNQGFTHAFIATYQDEAARDGFGPHPAHQKALTVVGPEIDKVLAFDFLV